MSKQISTQQQLFESFLDNTPLKTKGLIIFKKDEQDHETVTAVLAADKILFNEIKSSALTEFEDTLAQNNPMSIDTIDFMTQGIAKLCDKKSLRSAKLSDLFSSIALFTKGESVNPTPEFNLPVLVLSNNAKELNRFTKEILDHHVASQFWTNNLGKRHSSVAHMMVALNADLAIDSEPITRVTIDTVEQAHDTKVSVQEGYETDPISVAINNILDKSSEIQIM